MHLTHWCLETLFRKKKKGEELTLEQISVTMAIKLLITVKSSIKCSSGRIGGPTLKPIFRGRLEIGHYLGTVTRPLLMFYDCPTNI